MKMQGYNGSQLWDTAFAVQVGRSQGGGCGPGVEATRLMHKGEALLRLVSAIVAGGLHCPRREAHPPPNFLPLLQAIASTGLAGEFSGCLRRAHDYLERSQVGEAASWHLLCSRAGPALVR